MKLGKRTLGLGHSRLVVKKIRGQVAFLSFFRKISTNVTNARKIHIKDIAFLFANTKLKKCHKFV